MSFRFFNNKNTASKTAFSGNACFAACFILLLMDTIGLVSIIFSFSVLLLLALGVILVRGTPSKAHEVR